MFQLNTFEDKVQVSAMNLGLDLKQAVLKSLADKYEDKLFSEYGVILAVTRVHGIEGGEILPEDSSVHYNAKFEALVYQPKMYEVLEGPVVDITDFGVFVRLGPLDGLCHTSQIVDDFVMYDKKSMTLTTKKSKDILKIDDIVRTRIIAVSLEKKEVNKVNLTMRQTGLGALSWIERRRKEAKKRAAGKKAESK